MACGKVHTRHPAADFMAAILLKGFENCKKNKAIVCDKHALFFNAYVGLCAHT